MITLSTYEMIFAEANKIYLQFHKLNRNLRNIKYKVTIVLHLLIKYFSNLTYFVHSLRVDSNEWVLKLPSN